MKIKDDGQLTAFRFTRVLQAFLGDYYHTGGHSHLLDSLRAVCNLVVVPDSGLGGEMVRCIEVPLPTRRNPVTSKRKFF